MNKVAQVTLLLIAVYAITLEPVSAAPKYVLQNEARAALTDLYSTTPGAQALADSAAGILVFPSITKGGFIVGGQYGEGVLFKHQKVGGYYNTASASFGFQAGLQKFGYALFFMRKSDLDYLERSNGWDIGVGPTITIVDKGLATQLSTTTGRSGVYAFFFDQKGLMAGVGLQGTKISRINPK